MREGLVVIGSCDPLGNPRGVDVHTPGLEMLGELHRERQPHIAKPDHDNPHVTHTP